MTTIDLNIRPFEAADAEAAFALGVSLGLSPWTVDDYSEELQRTDSAMFAAVIGLKVVGFIAGRRVPGSTHSGVDAEIYNIGVCPSVQGSGIGSRLMVRFIDECVRAEVRDVWLDVRMRNVGAIKFYENFGFISYAVRPAFYRDPPDDGLVMRLRLG